MSHDHGGSQLELTESPAVVELADQWLRNPESMLKQLTAALNHFCSKYFDCEYSEPRLDSCGDVDAGGSSFRLKPEYENSLAFVIARMHLQTLAKAVDGVRDINPQVPFASEIVKALYTASMPFDADGFEKAVAKWMTALRRLGVWVKLQAPSSEIPRDVHGITLAIVSDARRLISIQQNILATVLIPKLKTSKKTANLSLRVLEALGEYCGFRRRPTPKVTAEVLAIIQQLQLRSAPQ